MATTEEIFNVTTAENTTPPIPTTLSSIITGDVLTTTTEATTSDDASGGDSNGLVIGLGVVIVLWVLTLTLLVLLWFFPDKVRHLCKQCTKKDGKAAIGRSGVFSPTKGNSATMETVTKGDPVQNTGSLKEEASARGGSARPRQSKTNHYQEPVTRIPGDSQGGISESPRDSEAYLEMVSEVHVTNTPSRPSYKNVPTSRSQIPHVKEAIIEDEAEYSNTEFGDQLSPPVDAQDGPECDYENFEKFAAPKARTRDRRSPTPPSSPPEDDEEELYQIPVTAEGY